MAGGSGCNSWPDIGRGSDGLPSPGLLRRSAALVPREKRTPLARGVPQDRQCAVRAALIENHGRLRVGVTERPFALQTAPIRLGGGARLLAVGVIGKRA
jgi:hypothetical protein